MDEKPEHGERRGGRQWDERLRRWVLVATAPRKDRDRDREAKAFHDWAFGDE